MNLGGWSKPWRAVWINLRAMFIYGADFFVLRPGMVLAAIGFALTLPLTFGPLRAGAVTFSLHWMLLGLSLSVLGLQSFHLGCIAQVIYDCRGDARCRWLSLFAYTRSVLISAGLIAAGISLSVPLVVVYLREGLSLDNLPAPPNHMENPGLLLVLM